MAKQFTQDELTKLCNEIDRLDELVGLSKDTINDVRRCIILAYHKIINK